MATSVFLGVGSVSIDAAGAIGGDGSVGDPLIVAVDDTSIEITGGNALATIGLTDAVVIGETTLNFTNGLLASVE